MEGTDGPRLGAAPRRGVSSFHAEGRTGAQGTGSFRRRSAPEAARRVAGAHPAADLRPPLPLRHRATRPEGGLPGRPAPAPEAHRAAQARREDTLAQIESAPDGPDGL